MDPVVKKEIKHIAIGEALLCTISVVVCVLLKLFSVNMLLFVIGGGIVAVGGFVWLCVSIQKCLTLGDKAKGYMTKSYIGRIILYAVWVAIAVKFGGSKTDYALKITGALPVLYPSLIIKFMNLIKPLVNEGEEE